MKRTLIVVGAVAAVAGLSALPALATGPAGGGMGMGDGMRPGFQDLDLDGNGEVTKDEMQKQRQVRFDKADTNGDGKLSAEELQARAMAQVEARVARMIARLDADGDGELTIVELPEARQVDRMFARMDADGSGAVSAAEFAQMQDRMQTQAEHRKGKHRDPGRGCDDAMMKPTDKDD